MAIDIIARGLAASLVGSDGKISSDKMPTLNAAPDGTTFYPVGALTDPTLLQGKTAEEILLMMLYGIVNPTFTNPKLSIVLNDGMAQPIIGRPCQISGTLTFDRGTIEPAYGTSGYRAGTPKSYSINGLEIDTNSMSYDFTIEEIPTSNILTLFYGVEYSEGEQPLNSIGQPFDLPFSAGSILNKIDLTAVYPLYNADGEDHDFEWFEDEDGAGYLAFFNSEANGIRQSFAVSSEMSVIGVKSYNTLTEQWEWLGSQTAAISLTYFDTNVITGESLGEMMNYILYTYNSTPVGARELRIYVQ